jgi:hypothetical protein
VSPAYVDHLAFALGCSAKPSSRRSPRAHDLGRGGAARRGVRVHHRCADGETALDLARAP